MATPEDPVLLILDNHSRHISLNIYNYCRENGIHMVTLPPHTSHRTQPLDLTVFGPLNNAFHKECQTYMNLNNYEKLTPLELIPLFTKAYLKIANAEKAVNGFKTAGIWPFDSNVFEQLTEEGNDEPANEYISAEEALNVESEPQEVPMNDPDILQPSTSGNYTPIHLEDDIEQEIIIYSEPTEDVSIQASESPSTISHLSCPKPSEEEIERVRKQVLKPFEPSEGPSTISSLSEEDKGKNKLESNLKENILKKPSEEDIKRVKRHFLKSPEPSAQVSFSTISPMPEKQEKGKGQGKRSKQHSIILTSSAMKTFLQNKEKKRTIKKEKEVTETERRQNKRHKETQSMQKGR